MTALTLVQKQTLKAFILADQALAALAETFEYSLIATALNAAASPDYWCWRTTTTLDSIQNAIAWGNMTPAAAPDGTTTWTNKALQAQGKQFNLQTLMIGRTSVPSALQNWRDAFKDALTHLPTKSDGGEQSANWTGVEAVMRRLASVAEKLFATVGDGSTTTPSTFGWEGAIAPQDMAGILAS